MDTRTEISRVAKVLYAGRRFFEFFLSKTFRFLFKLLKNKFFCFFQFLTSFIKAAAVVQSTDISN